MRILKITFSHNYLKLVALNIGPRSFGNVQMMTHYCYTSTVIWWSQPGSWGLTNECYFPPASHFHVVSTEFCRRASTPMYTFPTDLFLVPMIASPDSIHFNVHMPNRTSIAHDKYNDFLSSNVRFQVTTQLRFSKTSIPIILIETLFSFCVRIWSTHDTFGSGSRTDSDCNPRETYANTPKT